MLGGIGGRRGKKQGGGSGLPVGSTANTPARAEAGQGLKACDSTWGQGFSNVTLPGAAGLHH